MTKVQRSPGISRFACAHDASCVRRRRPGHLGEPLKTAGKQARHNVTEADGVQVEWRG